MSDYTFRQLFYFPKSNVLSTTNHSIEFSVSAYPTFAIFAEKDRSIEDSKTFICKSSGYQSAEEAVEAGERFRDALTLSFSHCRIGADLGHGVSRGGFSKYLIDKIQKEQNLRLINEVHGLMVYETDPSPSIIRVPTATLALNTPSEKFISDFMVAFDSGYRLSDRERISYSLYSDSFFVPTPTARLIFLVMAVESLVDPQKKSDAAVQYITEFIEKVRGAEDMKEPEKNSLLGSLSWLCDESRSQGCRRIIQNRLGNAIFNEKPAIEFFEECYSYRSSLVHGIQPYPSRDQVSRAAATLEFMVSKLISSCIQWSNDYE